MQGRCGPASGAGGSARVIGVRSLPQEGPPNGVGRKRAAVEPPASGAAECLNEVGWPKNH
eukprot:6427221-Alexandrium_andersonii.AAC.1